MFTDTQITNAALALARADRYKTTGELPYAPNVVAWLTEKPGHADLWRLGHDGGIIGCARLSDYEARVRLTIEALSPPDTNPKSVAFSRGGIG
jgi:hypothetical protein